MAPVSPKKLLARSQKAWTEHRKWNAQLEEVYRYAMPHRNLYSEQTEGADKNADVYFSGGISATTRGANRLVNDLVPPFEKIVDLQPGIFVDQKIRVELGRRLLLATTMFHTVLQTGGFHTSVHEFMLDFLTGQAAMLIDEGDDDRLAHFITVPRAQVAIDEGPNGRVDGKFRKHKLALRNIQPTWPRDELKIPPALQEKMLTDDSEEVVLDEITYRDYEAKVWRYGVFWSEGDGKEDDAHQLLEREYQRSDPWLISRFYKLPGEIGGRGPLLTALPDIKTANKTVELILKAAALAIVGVYTVAEAGGAPTDKVSIHPGAMIRVKSNGGRMGRSIEPLETNRNFDISQLVLETLTQNIKKMLFDDQLPPDTGAVRSPTEIVSRQKELSQDSSAAFGRFYDEFYLPLVQRVLDILSSKGLLDNGIKIDNIFVSLQIVSPLARSQNLEDVQRVLEWVEIVRGIAGEDGSQLYVAVEVLTIWLAEKLGVDMTLVRTETERKTIETSVAQTVAAAANQNQPVAEAA